MTPQISLIAALARNGVIGRDNALPWHLPADLAHFRALTLDKPIVMGRRTFESLPGFLPRRQHIVVSSSTGAGTQSGTHGVVWVPSPEAAIAQARGAPELMVIGGASLYRAFLPLARRMYLTWIEAQIDGDVRFPSWNPAEWREAARASRPADARNAYDLSFVTLERG